MKAIISQKQQYELLKLQWVNKLNRRGLAEKLGVSYGTTKTLLDADAPIIVSGKTFQAVNNYLISELAR